MTAKIIALFGIAFNIKSLGLTQHNTTVFGVPVVVSDDKECLVGTCSESELEAFVDSGKGAAFPELDTADGSGGSGGSGGMTKDDLKKELDGLEVEYSASANKAELQTLLDNKLAE